MEKYTTKRAAGARTISTLGGDYALKWDDETQVRVNAYAALLSQFARAGGFLDRLHGDAATAELFGVGRFMSCDSVRRNFASIPAEESLPWVWRESLRLLQDVLDLDPTVKPLYGHLEGAEPGYSPQEPGRPSHCCHTLCIAELRMALAVVVHPGGETSGTHSRPMPSDVRYGRAGRPAPPVAGAAIRIGAKRK